MEKHSPFSEIYSPFGGSPDPKNGLGVNLASRFSRYISRCTAVNSQSVAFTVSI